MCEDPYENDPLMESLNLDIYYIMSDQMHSRDDIFLMPVRNREGLIKNVRNYFEACEMLPRNESSYNSLKDMLTNIQSSGEDVDRIIEWYKSISGYGICKDTFYWNTALYWWCDGAYVEHQKRLPKRRFDEFISVAYRDFFLPRINFMEITKHDEKLWIGDDGQRSEWDEFLWQIFFKEIWGSPQAGYYQYFEYINMMSFWKKHRNFLSPDEQKLLLEDMIEAHSAYCDRPSYIKWDEIATLEDTLTIDNWPDFDAVKRDW